VTVLALNVDGLAVEGAAGPRSDPNEVLARIGYRLPRGRAHQDNLARIEVMLHFLSSRLTPLSIPSSFLVDAGGNVAAVYLGVVGWERLVADLASLEASPAAQAGRTSARPGRWFADPTQMDRAAYLGDYATLFGTSGFPEESQRLYELIRPRGGARSALEFYNLAKAAAQQGLKEQAMGHYRSALELDPAYGEALTGLGALLLMDKRLDEARPLFLRALDIDPNHATALVNLAMIEQARGEYDSALGRLSNVVARNPDYAEARLNLGSLLASMKRHDEAIRHLTKAVELNPKLTVAHLNLAAALMETQRWDEAERHYRQAESLSPRLAYPHFGLGNCRRDSDGMPTRWPRFVRRYHWAAKMHRLTLNWDCHCWRSGRSRRPSRPSGQR
jgi:tetratricopeptide (TPR) repeat protein